MKACPKCRRLIQHGQTYCVECAPIAEAERLANQERAAEYARRKYNRNYSRRRDPKYIAFYRSKPWKMTSRAKLTEVQYRCEAKLQGCTRLAVEVHHIKPIQTEEGWEERLEWSNLEAVCTSCHNRRHPEKLRGKNEAGVLDMREILRNL